MPRKRGDLNIATQQRMALANAITLEEAGKLELEAEAEAEVLSFFKYRARDLILSPKSLHQIASLRRDFPNGRVWQQMALRVFRRDKQRKTK